jgi:hypothetical protein
LRLCGDPRYPIGAIFYERYFTDQGDRLDISERNVRKDGGHCLQTLVDTARCSELIKADASTNASGLPEEEMAWLSKQVWLKETLPPMAAPEPVGWI